MNNDSLKQDGGLTFRAIPIQYQRISRMDFQMTIHECKEIEDIYSINTIRDCLQKLENNVKPGMKDVYSELWHFLREFQREVF